MSIEKLTRQERLEGRNVKSLSERSRGLSQSYNRLLNFAQVVESPEFIAKHPECDITDPSSDEFIDNTIQFGTTFGKAFKAIEIQTLPKLKELKEETDAIMQEKISRIEKQRIEALSLTPQQKKSLLGYLEQQLEQLESLAESSYLHSDVALRMTRARIATLSQVKTQEDAKPSKKRESLAPVEQKVEPVVEEKTNIVTFPNGKVVEADGRRKLVLDCLLARKYDIEEIAEIVCGNKLPDSVDSASNWIDKVSSEDLLDVGYAIVEVTIKGKVIVTTLEEKNLDTQLPELQKELKQAASGRRKREGSENKPAKVLTEEEYDRRLDVFEHILGQSFGRISVASRMGKNSIKRKYGWNTAVYAMANARTRLYSRVLRGSATEREIRIADAIIKTAPPDLSRFDAFRHFGKEFKKILDEDQFGHFGTYTLYQKDNQPTSSQSIQIEQNETTSDIHHEDESNFEVEEIDDVTLESFIPDEERPNLAAVAMALSKSGEILSEEFEEIRKKIEESNHIENSNPLEELRKLHAILSDENKAAEYVFSFEDDEEIMDFMIHLEENKELIHDLLPSEEEDEEFEIGPNGALILKNNKEVSLFQTQLETKIPNLKELVREKFEEVRANGAFKGITPADQITAVYHGIKHSDIEFAVSQKIVRPSQGGKSKMFVFDQLGIVALLIKTQYRSLTFTPKMRREFVNIIEQTEKEIIEEEKKKKGYESSSK